MMPRTSIFLAAEDVARLRSQIHNPHMARIWERTRRTADRSLGNRAFPLRRIPWNYGMFSATVASIWA